MAKDINQNEDPRLRPSPWNWSSGRAWETTFYKHPCNNKPGCQRATLWEIYLGGAAGLSLSLTQQGHFPPPPGSPLHPPNLLVKSEEPTELYFNNPVYALSTHQSERHRLVSLPGMAYAACWDPAHLPRRGSNTTFRASFLRSVSLSSKLHIFFICLLPLIKFCHTCVWIAFQGGGKRSQLCPPECLKQYLWKVSNWVY